MKYILHKIDLQSENPWDNKAVYLLYTELVMGKLLWYSLYHACDSCQQAACKLNYRQDAWIQKPDSFIQKCMSQYVFVIVL